MKLSSIVSFVHPKHLLFITFQLKSSSRWNSVFHVSSLFSFWYRLEHQIFRVFKIHSNCNFVGLLHHPFCLYLVLAPLGIHFQLLNHFLRLRITDAGSVPEMRIWSISFIKSDLKWCIHLFELKTLFQFEMNILYMYLEPFLTLQKTLMCSGLYSRAGTNTLTPPPPPPE